MTISTTTNRTSAAGNGSTTAFATGFKFFTASDLKVVLVTDSTGAEAVQTITTNYTVSGAGEDSGGTVTMVTAPASGETLVIIREQPYTQGLDLVENDPFPSESVEQSLDKSVILAQQNNDALGRTVRLPDGDTSGVDLTLPVLGATAQYVTISTSGIAYEDAVTLPASLSGEALSMIRVNAGETAYEFRTPTETRSDISAQASDADLTALAALSTTGVVARTGSATYSPRTITGTSNEISVADGDGVSGNPTLSLPTAMTLTGKTLTFAGGGLTNFLDEDSFASNSATAAPSQQSVKAYVDNAVGASAVWNDVVYLTNSDSPYTVTTSQNGKFFAVDTSGGAVTINLPAISSAGSGYAIGIKKTTSDANAITATPNGTDEINEVASSTTISTTNAGATFISDTDKTPDSWLTVDFGPSGGNMTVDNFADGVDFTAGSSTTLTLSSAPGSENDAILTLDGVVQHHDTWSLSGTTLTLDAAIPAGVSNAEVRFGTTLAINTPGDTTVTSAKLSGDITVPGDLTITDNLIMDVGTVTASTTQTQAGGQALTTDNVLISTCANFGDSVVLPSAVAGRSVWITNSGAEAAWVWPASGDAINEGTTDARDPVPLWPKESREYRAHDATGFYTPRPAGQHVLLDRVEGITTNGILSGFSADFIEYHISCVGIETEQSASKILMTISDDNQSTFESTGYYVGIHGQSSSGVDNDSSIANGAYFELHTDTGTGTGNNAAFGGHIDLFDPQRVIATNGHHTWTSYFAGKQSLGTFNAQLGAGGWASTNAITDVKIHTTTGNITKGNVYLYGIVK